MDLSDEYMRESKSNEVIVAAWVSTGLAILTVILKVLTTTRITRHAGWDDFFILLSLIFSIVASVFVHYAAALGLGRHTGALLAEFGPQRLALTAKIQILGYPFNIAAFSFPNISIAILVIKLLNPNPRRKCALMAMVVLQVILAMIQAGLAFAQCSPVDQLWERTIPDACWHPSVLNNYSYFVSAYTTLTDLVLAIVPISAFWSLQMNRSTKIGISVLMSLTFLSAVVTLIKATYLHLFNDTIDPLYNVVTLVFWGLVEQNIVIFAACAPTLRPFFRNILVTNRSGSRSQSNSKVYSLGLKSLASIPFSRRTFEQQNETGTRKDDHCSRKGGDSGTVTHSTSELPLSTGRVDANMPDSDDDDRPVARSCDGGDERLPYIHVDNASRTGRQEIWKKTDFTMQWGGLHLDPQDNLEEETARKPHQHSRIGETDSYAAGAIVPANMAEPARKL